MKKAFTLFIALILALSLSGCDSSRLVEGTDKTYRGIVTDCGMSVVNEGDYKGRAYIIIYCEDETSKSFWLAKGCTNNASINDSVEIESAIEESTGLLVATNIIIK